MTVMARTRVVSGPRYDFVAGVWRDPTPVMPPITTGHGFGSLFASRAVAGRQDRDLHRFDKKKGPSGTQERLSSTHGQGPIGQFGQLNG